VSKTVVLGVLGIIAVYLLPLFWPADSLGDGAMALAMIATGATVAYGARNFPMANRAKTSAEMVAPPPTRPMPRVADTLAAAPVIAPEP